jgi:immunoglobulin-like protein involved in spore germination
MSDDLLAKLKAVDPVTHERVAAESRSLGDLPGRIAAGESPVAGRVHRFPRAPRRAIALGLAAALLAIGVAVPLALLSPLGGGGITYGEVGDGWFRAGTLEDLQSNEVTYLPEVKIFVVASPNVQPYALDAVSPNRIGSGESLLFCTSPQVFFDPGGAFDVTSEQFDITGTHLRLPGAGPSALGMSGVPLRVNDGFVDVDTAAGHRIPGAPAAGPAYGQILKPCGNEYREVRPGVVEPIPATGLAPIEVSSPQPGDIVTSPVTIAGTADVAEANVRYQIKDASGTILVDDFTMATCGTGCRGDYSVEVPFEVTEEQSGTILVFEESLEDGSKINVVKVPVTLQPAAATAPIEVTTPSEGDIVSSPVTIAGTADVFEGTVSIRILGEDGRVLADTFTTATCSIGCRGDYSEDVAFKVKDVEQGTIQVFSASAETNGGMLHLVEIPVILAPKTSNASITVTSPAPGDVITDGNLMISGTADVFEATVSYRLVLEDGSVLRKGTLQATCGTGCRGDFTILFTDTFVSRRQVAVLQVFEASAKDGSPINVVEIPIVLVPFS